MIIDGAKLIQRDGVKMLQTPAHPYPNIYKLTVRDGHLVGVMRIHTGPGASILSEARAPKVWATARHLIAEGAIK